MNQKTSKALRKATGFKVHKTREYKVTNFSNKSRTYESIGNRKEYQVAKQEYLLKKRG